MPITRKIPHPKIRKIIVFVVMQAERKKEWSLRIKRGKQIYRVKNRERGSKKIRCSKI